MNVLHSIRLADQSASQRFRRRAKITRSQYLVLKALDDVQSSNVTQIIKKTGIDRGTMTELIQRLRNNNLISVAKDDKDRRSYKVKLRPAGKRLLQKVDPIVEQLENEIVAQVSPRNQKILVSALSSIAKAA